MHIYLNNYVVCILLYAYLKKNCTFSIFTACIYDPLQIKFTEIEGQNNLLKLHINKYKVLHSRLPVPGPEVPGKVLYCTTVPGTGKRWAFPDLSLFLSAHCITGIDTGIVLYSISISNIMTIIIL